MTAPLESLFTVRESVNSLAEVGGTEGANKALADATYWVPKLVALDSDQRLNMLFSICSMLCFDGRSNEITEAYEDSLANPL